MHFLKCPGTCKYVQIHYKHCYFTRVARRLCSVVPTAAWVLLLGGAVVSKQLQPQLPYTLLHYERSTALSNFCLLQCEISQFLV